ncbi:MAG: hypothetical protein WDO12_04960 [Pseudomonadota bacterium]
MKQKSFRWCMLVGAIALGAVAIFYFATYVELTIALGNNGLKPDLMQSIQALWLAFACHVALIALLYLLVAYKPHAVSREVIVILGMLQLVEAGLLFAFSGSLVAAVLLALAAVFVLVGALIWPKKLLPQAPATGSIAPV